jgi:CDP-glycerol glycerophosphotransferase (TagB/SpsB family)
MTPKIQLTLEYIYKDPMRKLRLALGYLIISSTFYVCGHFLGSFLDTQYMPIMLGILFLCVSLFLIITLTTRIFHLLRIPLDIINLPVYWLSFIVPKDPNLWIFTCQQGSTYAENSRYLFEHIISNHTDINAIWLTKNQSVYNKLKEKSYPVTTAYSLRGYWLSLRAGCIYLSHFQKAKSDTNDYATGQKTIKIQLWHGSPMKRIGTAIPDNDKEGVAKLIHAVLYFVFPFYANRRSCHKMLAASPVVAKTLKTAFNLHDHNVLICGYPKNDDWLNRSNRQKTKLSSSKSVIYMPTWRNNDLDLFTKYKFNPVKLNKILASNNIDFHIKLHHYSIKELTDKFKDLEKMSNIHIITHSDIYQHLDQYDVLITDYSSILFDFLLSNKPVVFAPFDYDEYLTNDRGFFSDYSELSPGPCANDWEELGEHIISILNFDNYKEERQRLCSIYNSYTDSNNAERITLISKKILKNKTKAVQTAFH